MKKYNPKWHGVSVAAFGLKDHEFNSRRANKQKKWNFCWAYCTTNSAKGFKFISNTFKKLTKKSLRTTILVFNIKTIFRVGRINECVAKGGRALFVNVIKSVTRRKVGVVVK